MIYNRIYGSLSMERLQRNYRNEYMLQYYDHDSGRQFLAIILIIQNLWYIALQLK